MNLLDAMRESEVPRLVFSSTCAVYGEPNEVPISEESPPRPANAYGASKLAVDMMISDYCHAHGIGAVSLRYFNVAGASGDVGRGSLSRDSPDPQHPAHRAGPQPSRRVVRHRLRRPPTARRSATTSTSRTSPTRICWPSTATRPRRPSHLQPRQRQRVLGAPGDRQGPRRHRLRDRGPRSAAPAGRPALPGRRLASGSGPSWAGWPRKPELEQMIGDAWAFAQARPDGLLSRVGRRSPPGPRRARSPGRGRRR